MIHGELAAKLVLRRYSSHDALSRRLYICVNVDTNNDDKHMLDTECDTKPGTSTVYRGRDNGAFCVYRCGHDRTATK